MAYEGKSIFNPINQQSIRFLTTARDSKGAFLEMESTWNPNSAEPPLHFHPLQHETFKVLSGELTVRLHDTIRHLKAGDELQIAPNTIHAMWNSSSGTVTALWRVEPAMKTEFLLEAAASMANSGKLRRGGKLHPLQAALLIREYRHEFRLAKPALWMQNVIGSALAPMARLAGFRRYYIENHP